MKTLILIFICIVVSYFVGIATVLIHLSKLNKKYAYASRNSNFDILKNEIEYLNINNILECAHAYGYSEGWKDRQKMIDNDIDEMLDTLSASTENKHIEN